MRSAELWRPVVGYEGIYEVSDLGRLRSVDRIDASGARRTGRILNPGKTPAGYVRANLHRLGKLKARFVHNLVLEAFVGPAPEGTEACHGDGNPSNNALGNLRWDTPSSNYLDKVKVGTCNSGERNGLAKLTAAQVRQIRERLALKHTRSAIARDYAVSSVAITNIATGRSWAQVR